MSESGSWVSQMGDTPPFFATSRSWYSSFSLFSLFFLFLSSVWMIFRFLSPCSFHHSLHTTLSSVWNLGSFLSDQKISGSLLSIFSSYISFLSLSIPFSILFFSSLGRESLIEKVGRFFFSEKIYFPIRFPFIIFSSPKLIFPLFFSTFSFLHHLILYPPSYTIIFFK